MRKHPASLVQGIRGTPAPVVKVLPDAPATLIESIPGKAHDTEGIHDRPRAGEFFSGGALKPGESIHRDDLDALAPRVGLGSQPGFEDPLGSARDHVQESAGTATVSYRSQVQNDGDVFVAVGGVAPHMGALRAPVAAHAHMQNRGAPPAGLMRQAPDHRATTNALAPAASTPPVLTSNPARQHCMVWPNALARHLQPRPSRRVNALRSGRSKIVLAMSRSFRWTVWQSPSSEGLDPYPATTRPTPPTTPTPSIMKSQFTHLSSLLSRNNQG